MNSRVPRPRREDRTAAGVVPWSAFELVGDDRLAFPDPDAALPGQDPVGAPGGGRNVGDGEPSGEFPARLGVGGVGGQVGPLVGVVAVVVKLLGAVGVAD